MDIEIIRQRPSVSDNLFFVNNIISYNQSSELERRQLYTGTLVYFEGVVVYSTSYELSRRTLSNSSEAYFINPFFSTVSSTEIKRKSVYNDSNILLRRIIEVDFDYEFEDNNINPSTVIFTDTSTGKITDYLWDFGDGITSTDKNPTHVYDTSDTYTVTLTVTNSESGDTDTITFDNLITINEYLITNDKDYGVVRLRVSFGTDFI